MGNPAVTLLVRFKSKLPFDEIMKIVEERAPEFEALSGLQQKYYLQNTITGEIAGLYLWDSPEAFTAYRDSELRATIAEAYQAEGEPHIEVYKVVKTLRDEVDSPRGHPETGI
ncbi:MAG: YdhR family protein [Acidobacteria bacterium]|jgi:heme-degrading monooxygenase HmoA|nr:YdhR family protein [Acidobacteriota bacterium]